MRTIVPFVLALSLYAQLPALNPLEQQNRLEHRVADGTATVPERITLAEVYRNGQNFDGLGREVYWLIENHPDAPQLRNPTLMLEQPVLSELAVHAADLWRQQAAKPGTPPKTIANAAWFFRLRDTSVADSMISAALANHPGEPDLTRMRGVLDAITLAGRPQIPVPPFDFDLALRRSPEAAKARDEVESSHDAPLLAGAVDTILQNQGAFDNAPALRDEDSLSAAERWAARAHEIDPPNAEWSRLLARVYDREAAQAADLKWKAALYRKADALDPNYFGLPALALAEFEAANDDAAAQDAHRLLDRKNPSPYFQHIAHTVLGRVALDQGDVETAKSELFASIPSGTPPGFNLEPNRTLAQDLIDHGERDIVIQFLEQSREFWKNDQGAINHYIKLIKAPGTHDILTRYSAGQELRGRPAPKLPIDDYSGKIVAVQFRNASCKTCADDFATVEKMGKVGVAEAAIEQAGHEALVRQYEIEQFPTWVLINREGRIADYLPGRLNEQDLERRIDQLNSPGIQQKLPAPAPLSETSAGKLAWSPVSGAESYVVQWDQRDEKGWRSDRDDHLVRVIPTSETTVALDPALGETASPAIRWRVFAVSRFGPGTASDWREMALAKP
jgi:hypothetical protein